MPSNQQATSSSLRIAGIVWLLAGVAYLVAEAITASGYTPAYSYSHNFISDLGVHGCGLVVQGREICSPLHDVLHVGFVAQGAGFLFAAAMVARAQTGIMRLVFLALAAIHAIGIFLVAIFHGDEAMLTNGTAIYHGLGAALGILGGNLAVLTAAWVGPWRHGHLRTFTIIVPVLGIVSVFVMAYAQATNTNVGLDYGTLERGSVYSIILWQMVSGVILLRSRLAETEA